MPKRCQEIRQINSTNQSFFTVFWRENHKKYEVKKYVKVSGEDAHTSVCTLCGYQGQKTACTSTSVAKTSYTQHWWVCDDCGKVFDEENHSWSDGICEICRYQCPHDDIGRKQVNEYTDYHIWYCKRCKLEKQEAHDCKDWGDGILVCSCGYRKTADE